MRAFRWWAAAVDLRSLRWIRGRPWRRFTGWTGRGGRAETRREHTVNPTTARRVRRTVEPLLVLAAVAVLAAPASADPPPSGDGGDSGTGGKAMVAVANPPPDNPPVDSVTGRTVAAVRNLSDKDPWPDPPLRSFDIDVSGGGTRDNEPRAATAGPPPIVVGD